MLAVWIGSSFSGMNSLLHILFAAIAGALCGALWAGIAGFLKATVGAHEVISTIMLNWIAIWVGVFLFGLGGPLQNDTQTYVPISNDVVDGAKLPVFWGDADLQGLHVGFFVAIGALVVYWLILNRTTLGYGVKAVGFNPEAARYGGINVSRNYFLAMAISGAFAGLAGAVDILGWQFRLATGDIQAATIAFVGIAVALLGRNTAVGVALAALLFGGLLTGTSTRNLDPEIFKPELASNLTLLIQGLVVLFVGADVIVLWLLARLHRKKKRAQQTGGHDVTSIALPVAARAAPRPPRRRLDRHRARPARRLDRAAADLGALVGVEPRHLPDRGHARHRRDHPRRAPLRRLSRSRRACSASSLAYLATLSGVGKLETVVVWSALFASTLRYATPLIFAAMGGMFSERSGVTNIGLEGMMLIGAFFGILGADKLGAVVLGLLVAILAGGLMALLHAVLSIHLRADQIVGGTAINFLALGLTGYLFIDIYGQEGTPTDISSIPQVNLGFLDDVPFFGTVFGHLNLMIWVALLLIPLASIVLFKTPLGLRIRAVGEHPRAADTVGIYVYGVRYGAVVLSGMLAACGGAYLSIGFVNSFNENMTAGRGFIALAAVIFGNWRPFGAAAACLLFGFSSALAQRLPEYSDSAAVLFQALPYVLTLIAVAGVIGRSIPPAAVGRPYEKS